MKRSKLLTSILAAGILVPCQASLAASGDTNITVKMPNLLILHYIPTLTLDFSSSALDEAVSEGGGLTIGPTSLAATVSGDAGLTGAGLANASGEPYLGSVAVTVQNAWAVRAITDSGEVQLVSNLDSSTATLTVGSVTSTITLSGLDVSDGTSTASTITFAAPGMGKANAQLGDIKFNLDLSAVRLSGDHAGAQYTLTATGV